MLKTIAGASLVALSIAGPLRAQETAFPDTMIIMDASNSMWGQIDGVSKIEIAREVLGDLLGEIQTESNFGLIAYGHRETASCSDIEIVLPVAPLDGAVFSEAVNQLLPMGRTPLSAAVELAAQTLQYQTRPARIIVLTDGLESCDADPCALAAELEKTGVDFTTHVIGFGISQAEDQSQIRCLAENTGGLYFGANTAAELGSALEIIAQPVQYSPPRQNAAQQVSVMAPDNAQPGDAIEIIWEGPENSGDYLAIALPDSALTSFSDYARTSAGNPALLNTPETIGVYEIRYISPTTNEILGVDHIVIGDIEITLDGPDAVNVGDSLTITWDGASFSGDRLVLTSANDTEILVEIPANDQRAVVFAAPGTPGDFDIRYLDINNKPLGELRFTVDYGVSFESPAQMLAGGVISIGWTGPDGEGDRIILVQKSDPDDNLGVFVQTAEGAHVTLLTPDLPGEYEIRYVTGNNQNVIARVDLELTRPDAAISAPQQAVGGTTIEIEFSGPDNPDDYLSIAPKDAPADRADYTVLANSGSPASLTVPELAGEYEIRYQSGQSGFVLAQADIEITAEPTILDAEETAIIGSIIQIVWQGPQTEDDYITIVPISAPDDETGNFTYSREGPELGVISDDFAGDYELRYISGETGAVLARRPITLLPPPVIIDAPEISVAGATISINWDGPDAADDYVAIVPVGAPEGEYGNYTYTRTGTPLYLFTQDTAGDYEIRYISGHTNEILARSAIALSAPDASISSVSTAVAGSEILVEWIGPDNQNDLVTIVPVGAPSGEYGNYTFTRRGAELGVLTTDIPGEYELRYLSGQSFATLASQPINLTAPSVTIDASPVGHSGSLLEVTWTGPSNKNDFLTAVPVGAPDGALGAYQFTRKGNTLQLMLPDETGAFEIRYISGQSMRVLHSLPLTIINP